MNRLDRGPAAARPPLPDLRERRARIDARLLALEAPLFGSKAGHAEPPADDPAGPSAVPFLWSAAGVGWLSIVDPLFQALTPRNFAGIPAPQLLAVILALPVCLLAVDFLWARAQPRDLRIVLRHLLGGWRFVPTLALLAFLAR